MPVNFGRPGLVKSAVSSSVPAEPEKTPTVRDVMVVLLGSALIRMESDKLNVGQTAELLLKMLDREGYKVEKK
jgi:hypothetical protein